jgi:hypothetical protein
MVVIEVTEDMIGNLMIITRKNWENFKNRYPYAADELDYAVVKELDEKALLVEKQRINKVLDGLHQD